MPLNSTYCIYLYSNIPYIEVSRSFLAEDW
jgi:hypothetical protein